MKTEAMFEWLGELLGEYEGRHIKSVSTGRIVPETRHHPVAPPRPNSLLGLIKPYEWGLLIRADNVIAAAYTPRSHGESMADRMDIMERLTNAAASFAGGIDGTIERRDFHEALRAAGFDFWGGVRKYLSMYTMINSHLVR